LNAIAGGGSFVTFPALVFAGLPSIAANASSTVALFPGSLASAWACRDDLRGGAENFPLRPMLPVSVAGGGVGAVLLLLTPQPAFDAAVPWLLLAATVAFAGGRRAGAALRRRVRIGPAAPVAVQFLLAVYGGYFGGAVGIMMMAAWSLFGVADIRAMNAAKTLLVGATNSVAVVCFAVAGPVWWPQTLAMLAAAAVGGYGGARLARRLDPGHVRIAITVASIAVTAVFFLRG
jgi:uncharacterized membrane protein YfcA